MSAEFMTEKVVTSPIVLEGMAAMGRPVPAFRKQAGYEAAKDMGLGTEAAFSVVASMSECLERDLPYEAMAAGMKRLDLTGTYRLMAYLLTGEEKEKA